MAKVTKRILCYGDSLTAGFCCGGFKFAPYPVFLKEKLDTLNSSCLFEVNHFGFCGWTTKQLLDNAHNKNLKDFVGMSGPGLAIALKEKHYDLLVLMAGNTIQN